MGTKENIEYIKQELSNEEKLLESLIKVEKFYKRYKKPLIALGAAVLLGSIGYIGYEMKTEHDLRVSNEAYRRLLIDPKDREALEVLKRKNPALYRLYLYQTALKQRDLEALRSIAQGEDPILADLARYHLGVLKEDRAAIDRYANVPDAILKEMAILEDAYLLDGEGEVSQAHRKLSQIAKESPAAPFATLLRHYGVK